MLKRMKSFGRLWSKKTHNKESDSIPEKEPEKLQTPKPIPGTPLAAITIPSGIAIVLGNDVVSNRRFKTFKEAQEYVMNTDFEMLITIIGIAIGHMYNLEKTDKK